MDGKPDSGPISRLGDRPVFGEGNFLLFAVKYRIYWVLTRGN
jgi:hypothetical protein